MAKVKVVKSVKSTGIPIFVRFYCDGCEGMHILKVSGKGCTWEFNNDFERPTFKPSVLVNKGQSDVYAPVCHSFITNGTIQYLNDCTHPLAGQTVELPDIRE